MVKQAEKKKPARLAILPAMGMVLALTYAAMAYFLGPMLFDLLVERSDEFALRIEGNEKYFRIGLSLVIWFFMLVVSMLLVSIALGEDPEKEMRMIKPRPGDKKGTARYIKYQEKLAKTRQSQIEEYKKKQAQQEAELKKKR